MIVGKPDDEPTADLPPPSYQTALAAAPGPQPGPSHQPPPHPTDTKTPLPESSPTSPINPYRPHLPGTNSSSNKPRPSFLSRLWGPVGTALQVKQTTQSLVRDLVQSRPPSGSHDHPDRRLASDAARSVLDSCAAACEAQALDLAGVLREPFIEGHTPVYWAVLVHDSSSSRSGPDDDHTDSESLAEILIARALTSDAPPSPLSLEVRAACTLASDDALWRRLRCRFPRLDPPPAGPENLILSGGVNGKAVCDEASVEAKADGAFCVQVKIPMFQKRMRVIGSVGVEFIAGGRLFRLEFFVNGSKTRGDHTFADGAWIAQISLLAPSAPTKVFSRLTIPPAPPPAPTPTSLPTPTGSTTTTTRRPAIVLKLVANEELYPDSRGVRVAVEDRALQHQGSAFLDQRGALVFMYEVQFTAPPRGQPECVIC